MGMRIPSVFPSAQIWPCCEYSEFPSRKVLCQLHAWHRCSAQGEKQGFCIFVMTAKSSAQAHSADGTKSNAIRPA